MNEFGDGGLTSRVQQLQAEVARKEAMIADLKARLAESEEQYVALQEANNEKWTKCQSLEKDVEHLRKSVERLQQRVVGANDEIKYWQGSYLKMRENAEVQEGVYLKVIRELSNRD